MMVLTWWWFDGGQVIVTCWHDGQAMVISWWWYDGKMMVMILRLKIIQWRRKNGDIQFIWNIPHVTYRCILQQFFLALQLHLCVGLSLVLNWENLVFIRAAEEKVLSICPSYNCPPVSGLVLLSLYITYLENLTYCQQCWCSQVNVPEIPASK
jgi:hypothetical protein